MGQSQGRSKASADTIKFKDKVPNGAQGKYAYTGASCKPKFGGKNSAPVGDEE